MYTLCIIDHTGQRRNAVARTKKAVMLWKAKLQLNSVEVAAWRLHDGNGWCAGSDCAWQDIQGIVGQQAEIVI